MKKTKVKMNKPVYLGMSILVLAKRLCTNYGMNILNQNINKKQNYVMWILIALLLIFLPKTFLKILIMILWTNKCIIKRRNKFKDCYDSVFKNKTILRSQLRFKSDQHIVYTEEINKIAINSNDDKKLQTFIKVLTYPYWTNAFKLCESELIALKNKKCI